MVKARERIAMVIAREAGRSLPQVLQDIERDNWLSPQEAMDYGLVSRVIQSRAELH